MQQNNLPAIAALVAEKYQVPLEVLSGRSRLKENVFYRRIFALAAHLGGYSFIQIGRYLQRDHTTIIHSVEVGRKRPEELEAAKEIVHHLATAAPPATRTIQLSGKYARIYELFNGKCAACSFDEILEVHHIIPRRAGGTDDPENLLLLCPNHHALADRGMLFLKDFPKTSPLSPCPQP